MRYTEIAPFAPFEGKPKICLPNRHGATQNKPIMLRIPVLGKRPIKITADSLPAGLTLDKGIITGSLDEGEYRITVNAENELGSASREIVFEIGERKLLPYPLLGFTTWNAFGSDVSDEKVRRTVDLLNSLGLAEVGYAYMNIDSGWQGVYGGELDSIQPNKKFPCMKCLVDYIHSNGFKAGIYSTPMLEAWGCPEDMPTIPGCTVGESDIRFDDTNGGIGLIHKEENNARQWAEWGFDYLKYDWKPTEAVNADLMRRALDAQYRDFAYCVTVSAELSCARYWKKHVNNYRNCIDSDGTWPNLLTMFEAYDLFAFNVVAGHYVDLDMLELGCGVILAGQKCQLNEDEQILAYTLRAITNSPIQISCDLDRADDFLLSVLGNEEVIAINQDFAVKGAEKISTGDGDGVFAYRRPLSDGEAIAFFNLGGTAAFSAVKLDGKHAVRDPWAKKDLGELDTLSFKLEPHTARLVKIK